MRNFRYVYRGKQTPIYRDNRVCKLCDRKLSLKESCLERESVTLCYNCVRDVHDSQRAILEHTR